MADPKDQVNQSQGQRQEPQRNKDEQNQGVTPTDGGLGQRGQSGEQRNDACNDPGQHNAGVTGH